MIVTIGCSFTYGKVPGLESHEHTFPYIIHKMTKMPVLNFGTLGGSNPWNDFILKKTLEQYSPSIVFYQATFPARYFHLNNNVSLQQWRLIDRIESPIKNNSQYFTLNHDKYTEEGITHFQPTVPKDIGKKYYKLMSDEQIAYINSTAVETSLMRLRKIPHFAFDLYNEGFYGLEDLTKRLKIGRKDICDEGGHLNLRGNTKLAEYLCTYMKI